MLSTGIDVPEITKIVFMRRIKSRILYEQMLGRVTRLCSKINKTHFDIYDAVDLYSYLDEYSSMKPVVANPSVTFDELFEGYEKLSEKIGITSRAVEKQVATLVEKGLLKREGSPKGGHWEILK